MIARIIEEETTLGEVVTVMRLQAGDIGLAEITLPPDTNALGKKLSELARARHQPGAPPVIRKKAAAEAAFNAQSGAIPCRGT